MIHAVPLDVHVHIAFNDKDNIFEWHFTIHGTPNSDYEGGIYHGRILLPPVAYEAPTNHIHDCNGFASVG